VEYLRKNHGYQKKEGLDSKSEENLKYQKNLERIIERRNPLSRHKVSSSVQLNETEIKITRRNSWSYAGDPQVLLKNANLVPFASADFSQIPRIEASIYEEKHLEGLICTLQEIKHSMNSQVQHLKECYEKTSSLKIYIQDEISRLNLKRTDVLNITEDASMNENKIEYEARVISEKIKELEEIIKSMGNISPVPEYSFTEKMLVKLRKLLIVIDGASISLLMQSMGYFTLGHRLFGRGTFSLMSFLF
jgi:hypothetical protein